MRDINDYSNRYSVPGFEQYKVLYRRKKILEIVETYKPKKILEIGCGYEPLFQFVKDADFTIVEPSSAFYENAMDLAQENGRKINIINDFFEEAALILSNDYDLIICAALLHEVEYPDKLLDAIARVCNRNTIVCIVVPNANSLHRLLGKEMNLIADVHDMSEGAIDFQQHMVFDRNSLSKIVTDRGFEVVDEGAFFVKPFSHKQMYEIMQAGILGEEVLDGLYTLGNHMSEFASEIYVNCKLKTI